MTKTEQARRMAWRFTVFVLSPATIRAWIRQRRIGYVVDGKMPVEQPMVTATGKK